ncbi:MAG: L-lactate dehydrogenase [Betaproteobacteria bacterium]|nr:L-lactate dehydrogenase [Betaproteobacteria bacterium]
MGATYNVVPATPLDYRRLAEKRLPRFLFDYIDGGANDEVTLARNVDDFRGIDVKQRVLRDVSGIDTSTTLLGGNAAMPLILAPIGMAGMFARRGELQAVRAANAANVPFTLSTVGICPIDEVRAASGKPFWFQLYMIKNREAVRGLLERAMQAGCTTLVFTVDLPMPGLRHRDTRNGMFEKTLKGKVARGWQLATRPRWIVDVGVRGKPHSFGNYAEFVDDPNELSSYKSWIDSNFDRSVTWKDIEWVRGIWKGKILVKGILEPDDARAAVGIADGVIVSNHGARQLDSVASSIAKLPGVVDAVGDRLEVYMDGGVRSGLDVFKALALGARGVLIGRPWAWALAAGGEVAVSNLLGTFQREFEVAMALNGVTKVSDIRRDAIDKAT